LPPGVPRGLWDYAQADHIATGYDDYFAFNSLFDFDEEVLQQTFDPPGLVVDLGCGTGRALIPLARRGHRAVAIDLSLPMLSIVQEKAQLEGLPIACVQANLVEMHCLRTDTADYCMCMFSTLGMIRGRSNRRAMLAHVRRILKPGGRFVLHVHNIWYNLYDPGGPWWLLRSLAVAPWRRDEEVGDKFFDYRGIPRMYLHVFRRRELLGDLRQAGFRIRRVIPLDTRRRHPLRMPWLFGGLRANGWIVVCE
jgi:SAM-dependent methyltransferase